MKTKHPSTPAIRHSAFTAVGTLFLAALTLFTTSPRAPAQTVWTNALSFDGVNDYVDLPDAVWFNGDFTVEAWVKLHAVKTWSRIADFSNGQSTNAVDFILSDGTSGKPRFDVVTNRVYTALTAPQPLPTNQWVHLAFTLSNTTGRILVNGVVVTNSSAMGRPEVVTRTVNYLARSGWNTDPANASAEMDEVRIWNVARNQAEIQAAMYQPLTGTESNLVAYYRFDEGSGLTAYDATTNHLDGTLTNGPTWLISTVPAAPVVGLGYLSGVTTVSATLHTYVNPGNLPTTAWFEWGATTNYGNITSNINLSAANVLLDVGQPISGLTPGTHYYFRLVATNALGVAAKESAFSTIATVARYVNAASTNATPPYLNWNTAATNIQDALNVALPLDEIVVTNGTYGAVSVAQPVALRSVNGPAVTLINGAGVTNCVVLASGASLSGFTLTNGFAASGGGVSCAASATVSNCVLTGNSATGNGGGAYSGTLNNCVLTGNAATTGGGAYLSTLNNCVLTGNSAAYYGGGAFVSMLRNCTVTGNSAARYGGGTARSACNNCILYFNTAPAGANYCLLYQAYSITLNHCCTTPTPLTGVGNITLDPELASDSHLSANSPCRGAGSAAYTTGTDLDGEAWANPPAIGCDEYHAGAVTGPLTVAIAAAHTNVAAGFPVAVTTRIDGRTTASAWDFGAGIVLSNQPYAIQAWAAPGDYPVILRAWNESLPGGVSATVTVHVVTAPVLYVAPASTNPVPPYASWATAATNLQHAVNALDADTVPGTWVLATNGTYAPVNVTRPAFLRSVNGPEFTTINGGRVARCVDLANGAGLFGFTLTNGRVANPLDGLGGGVRCASANTWVSNCVLTGNWAYGGGGAALGTLDHCTLTGNWAEDLGGSESSYGGGGAQGSILNYCTLSNNTANMRGPYYRYTGGGGAADATLNYCTVYNNHATNTLITAPSTGGGASFCVLNHCTIANNTSDATGQPETARGGGAYASTLSHCTLTNNRSEWGGAGAYASTLNHCTVNGCFANSAHGMVELSVLNNCTLSRGAWWAAVGSTLNNCTVVGVHAGVLDSTLNNCIVYYSSGVNYNNSTFNYCCTTPLPTNGVGNITNEPAFLDRAGGNLRLQTNSPCINAGNNAASVGTTDLDGNTRIAGGRVDIGAYEFQGTGLSGFTGWLWQYGLPTDGSADYTDFDGDRLNNWQEWRCLTDPTNALSVLRLLSPLRTDSDVSVTWQSVAGVNYSLERSTNLAASPAFTPLATNLPGLPGTTTYTDTNAANVPRLFYRVGVQ